ncbi:MAG: hypothetical protein IJA38_00410 [Bacteroidales bacterium]|nr:hypothetical protein [Bacteroidales bacterium]MBP3344133.1 hypothetical protein [Bacteroidales bacterium]MBQ3521277.1 hypothetical protein [Bacteroidales bacterium]MBQ5803090.1 hypothetical protein [Bacteroidales bacterium]MBQ6870733.1 hypothetical protein [Bacteroidales bacterium]
MANLRVIKKDVIYLINEVISDCWVFMYLNNEAKQDEAKQIITDAVALGDNLFDQINHYPKEETKKHFKQVNEKLLAEVDALFKRISALAK